MSAFIKKRSMKPTVGIIGGAGPLATIDIEQKILKATKKIRGVLTDQDYYNFVVFNYPSTHDRNDAVFLGKPNPLDQYIEYILSMTSLNVDLILLPCNTAHIYLPLLREKTKIPIISMIEKTLVYFKGNFPKISKVGLISTKVTKEKKLYHSLFYKDGIEIIDIEPTTQDLIMNAIYIIKTGIELNYNDSFIENYQNNLEINVQQVIELKNHPYKHILVQSRYPNPSYILQNAIEELVRKGCNHIIFGCTELPLVIPYLEKKSEVHFIDPNMIAAEATVETLMAIENQI